MNLALFEEIQNSGGQAYLVGGYVRDKIIGIPNKDIDLEVFGLEPEQLELILNKFGKWKLVGNFQVYLLNNKYEISLSRDSLGNINKKLSLSESAKRRDLTINSIYYNPLENKYFDSLDGISDIHNKILKYSSKEHFLDDPLRILRVAYFLGKYEEFSIDANLLNLIKENISLISNSPKERIFNELNKILLNLIKPSKSMKFLYKIGVLNLIFNQSFIDTNNFLVLDKLTKAERNIEIMWTNLYLVLNKNALTNFEKGFINFSYNKTLVKNVKSLIINYPNLIELKVDFNLYSLKKIILDTNIKNLLKIYKTNLQCYDLEEQKFIKKISDNNLKLKNSLIAFITGKDLIALGFVPNQDFGKILDEVYDLQLKEVFSTPKDALAYVKIKYKEFTNLP